MSDERHDFKMDNYDGDCATCGENQGNWTHLTPVDQRDAILDICDQLVAEGVPASAIEPSRIFALSLKQAREPEPPEPRLAEDIATVRKYHHPTWLTDKDIARLLDGGASGAGPRKVTPRQVRDTPNRPRSRSQ